MIYLLIITLMAHLFFFYFLNGRNIFSPSLIVDVMFLLSALVMVTNWKFFGYEDISFESVLVINASIILMALGEFVTKGWILRQGGYRKIDSCIDEAPIVISKAFLIVTMIIVTMVTIGRAVIIYKLSLTLGNSGGFWASFSYVRKYVNAGFSVDVGRYITYPAVYAKTASLYCIYVFCHNKIFCKQSSWKLLMPAIVYSFYTFTSTARTGVLEIGCAFVVMYFALTVRKNGIQTVSNKKMVRTTVIVGVILVFIFIVAGNIRTISYDENTASDLVNYAGSPLIVFSRWLKNYELSPFVGYSTAPNLINILNKLGLTKVSLSHSEIYTAEYVLASSKSNLKTWLKAPIQDFSLAGMLLSRVVLGVIYSYITYRITLPTESRQHPGKFIFACLLFYPLISAAIADKYGNYIQLETLFMVFIFVYIARKQNLWSRLDARRTLS